jgi:hypothetical protein
LVGVVTRRHRLGARLPDHLPQDQLITIKERTVTANATVATTETLEVPGARLSYDVRRNDESTEPILFLIASPMAAAGFGTGQPLHRPDRGYL